MTNYEDENGVDVGEALSKALNALNNFKFQADDLDFYFNQIEIKMQSSGVKKNFTKFQVLASIIPPEVQSQVKPLLRKKEADLNNAGYKKLKDEIIRIFGPKQDAAFKRAMSRVLTDKPSTLARELVDDMCEKELDGCCCHKWIVGQWKKHLPLSVRQSIANMKLTKDTFNEILQHADEVFEESTPSGASVAAATWSSDNPTPVDLNQAYGAGALPTPEEVAALRAGGRGGWGRGFRGGRGGRGRGGGGQRGGGSQQGGGTQPSTTQSQGGQTKDARQRWPNAKRSADQPPIQSCRRHWIFGKEAHWCEEPGSCPWKKYFKPRD